MGWWRLSPREFTPGHHRLTGICSVVTSKLGSPASLGTKECCRRKRNVPERD